ncbi:hypothetical protein TNCV_2753831 [Trichonephila clavipes]|nr:hypothetical protein TNCV_2753831 [Trichonephila clavipes]
MDQIDALPEHISTTVMPVTLPEKPDALENAAWQGQVHACIIYQESNRKRAFVLFCKGNCLDIIPETILSQLMENGFNLGDFRKMKRYDQKAYKLPPPTLVHVPAEKNKRPLEEQPGPSSKRNRLFITPVIRPPVAPVLNP